ncbi:hypothetical protein pb186bvf_009344 [Paramecium bursaria]
MDQRKTQFKRTSQIDHSILYHLLNEYMYQLMLNTKINKQEKQIRLNEMGKRLGSNLMESIASTQFDKIHYSSAQEGSKYLEYVKFLCKDFWTQMFGQIVSKMQVNRLGNTFEIEDKYDLQDKNGIKVQKTGFNMTRRIKLLDKMLQDDYLMYWTSFVRGLIQGGMKTLTVESDVDVEFINNEPSDLKVQIIIKGISV